MNKTHLIALLITFFSTTYALEKLHIGTYQSRAIWKSAQTSPKTKAPLVILIPGSGPNGPEVMMPPEITADEKEHSLAAQMATPFNRAGFHTLSLGKPGIEFFSGWDRSKKFYDKELYENLKWDDLISNLEQAVEYARQRLDVDSSKIYLLGHSQGTLVTSYYAMKDPSIAGLFLLGYVGSNLLDIVSWQVFDRDVDYFLKTDVDSNHDNYVSRQEADLWPEFFSWDWQDGQVEVSVKEIHDYIRNDEGIIDAYESIANSPLFNIPLLNEGMTHQRVAALKMPLYVFNGDIDLQTPASEALELGIMCKIYKKENCHINIIPGVGHGFSPPKAPRSHPLLDLTIGPVEQSFQDILFDIASNL